MTLQEIKSKIGKYKILSVIIISYVVVISLFVAAFIAIYFYSQNAFRSYFDYNSRIIADNISDKYEESIESINTMVVNSILSDNDLQNNIQEIWKGTGSYESCGKVRNQLSKELYDTNYLTEALIYIENRDLIIFSTGFCSTKTYYEAYAKDNFSDYDEFLSFLDGEKMPKNLYSQDTMQMFSRKQYYLYEEGVEVGKIIIKNDMESLLNNFTDKNSNVVIVEDEYIIASSDGELASELLKADFDSRDTFELDGKLVYKSSIGGGRRKCFYIVDMEKMNEANKTYSVFVIGACVICLLICIAACTFFVRFHYMPIKRFADFIRAKNKDNGENSGYRIFSNAVSYIETNEKSAEKEIEAKERNLREMHLEQWLLYKKSNSKEMIKPDHEKKSALVVIKAEEYENIFFEELYEKKSVKLEMANYILANIFDEELCNNFADVIKCKINDLLVWLVVFDNTPQWKDKINEIAQRMLKLTKEEFNISFEYYTSDSCDTMEKLSEDFDLLMVEIKQKNENTDLKLFSENEKEEKTVYYFPEALKKQLYDSIESGNAKSAAVILDNILNHNVRIMHSELNNLKALATEIYNMVILRLRCLDIDVEKLFEENRLGKDIIMCEQEEVLESELKKFIESMCGIFRAGINNTDSVYAKTRRIIYQHYKDPILSSTIIADKLGLSRDYFLSVFKKESGMKVADYIHQIRIEEACKILEKTNSSIEKIATQVGYSNTKTFSRVFVKLKGVTPGVYRDKLK